MSESPWFRRPIICREPISASVAAISSAVATAAPALTAISTIAGTALQVVGAQRQASAMQSQAAAAEFNARQELIRGQQQSSQLRESLLRTLASQRSRYAASGLAIDQGTPAQLQDLTAEQAERELAIAGSNATIRSEQQRMQASLLEDGADWTSTAGYVRGGVNLFEAYDRYSQRRPGT